MSRSPISFDLETGARTPKARGAMEILPGNLSFWNRALVSFPPDSLPAGIALLDRNFILVINKKKKVGLREHLLALDPDHP
jgi:hypothetical protein